MFVDEHCEAVRADLAHHYPGRRLEELFTGGMSWAELDDFLDHLPMESATQTALRDELGEVETVEAFSPAVERPHGAWSKQELLLADLIDTMSHLVYVQLAKAGVKEAKPPTPVWRPGVRRTKTPSPAARAYLQKIRDDHDALEGA